MVTGDLTRIPGVGKNMERHLLDLGYGSVESLRGQDPEEMYARECVQSGRHVDRCALYVYRLAVYFAENERHDPEKLKWWNWKD
jgi:hypothetical protein